jgi:hypothetical protein
MLAGNLCGLFVHYCWQAFWRPRPLPPPFAADRPTPVALVIGNANLPRQ